MISLSSLSVLICKLMEFYILCISLMHVASSLSLYFLLIVFYACCHTTIITSCVLLSFILLLLLLGLAYNVILTTIT